MIAYLNLSPSEQTNLARTDTASLHPSLTLIIHSLPIDPLPPSLQELLLASNPVIHHPSMFPRTYTQHRRNLHPTRRQPPLPPTRPSKAARPILYLCLPIILRGHIDALLPPVGTRIRRTREVGVHDAQLGILVLAHEPDETWAEHGGCRGEELGPEGLQRRKGVVDVFEEGGWDLDGFGGE